MKELFTPLRQEDLAALKAGEELCLTGIIYTARDQAHKRLVALLSKVRTPPRFLTETAMYYCGPTQTPKGRTIGSCGPTTSKRMDVFTPVLLKAGQKAMIGKGSRSPEVFAAIKRHKAVYFLAYAGCGALLSQYVKKAKLFLYADLGPEAIYELQVEKFPLIVGIDSKGNSVFRT